MTRPPPDRARSRASRLRQLQSALPSFRYRLLRYRLALNLARDAHRRRHHHAVLLYQVGKVGSSSILHALRESWPGAIYHLHTLRHDHLQSEVATFRKVFSQRRTLPAYVSAGLFLRQRLARPPGPTARWRIVTLVRDPLARNISTFFQTLDSHFTSFNFTERIQAGGDTDLVSDLQQGFLRAFDHSSPLSWFERELQDVLGIDVYATPFQHHRGFATYQTDTASVLLLRCEDLDRLGEDSLRSFLELPSLRLLRANEARSKSYAAAYRDFLESFAAPPSLLAQLYDSRLATHFYTPEERAALRERWSSPEVRTI